MGKTTLSRPVPVISSDPCGAIPAPTTLTPAHAEQLAEQLKALEVPLGQSFGQLDAAARRKFSLVLLPHERAAPAGQPATPPPSTVDAPGRKGDR